MATLLTCLEKHSEFREHEVGDGTVFYLVSRSELASRDFYNRQDGDHIVGSKPKGYKHLSLRRDDVFMKMLGPREAENELCAYFLLDQLSDEEGYKINLPSYLSAYVRASSREESFVCSEYLDQAQPFSVLERQGDVIRGVVNFISMESEERYGIIRTLARQTAMVHFANIDWPEQLVSHNLMYDKSKGTKDGVINVDLEGISESELTDGMRFDVIVKGIYTSGLFKFDQTALFRDQDDIDFFLKEYLLAYDKSLDESRMGSELEVLKERIAEARVTVTEDSLSEFT
jgi:hypothetical protein